MRYIGGTGRDPDLYEIEMLSLVRCFFSQIIIFRAIRNKYFYRGSLGNLPQN